MCYVLILSTTSTDDLSRFNNDGMKFDGKIPDHLPAGHLLYSNKWYVGSRTGRDGDALPDVFHGIPR